MTEPTQPATVQEQPPVDEPRAAVIEVVERHHGEKYPYTGNASIICPNHLRINGMAVWATMDNPATIREIAISGTPGTPFAVTVQMAARALNIGGTPAFDPAAVGADAIAGAVVEIPDTSAFEPGDQLARPYVLLNGQRLYIDDAVRVDELTTDGGGGPAAVVTLTLLCRQFTVDDEPCPVASLLSA